MCFAVKSLVQVYSGEKESVTQFQPDVQGRSEQQSLRALMVLGPIALDLDPRYFSHFERLVERHGYDKTMLKLYQMKKTLAATDVELDTLFLKAMNAKEDPYALAQCYLSIVSSKGSAQATSLLTRNFSKLRSLAAQISVSRVLERKWKVKGINPSAAFIRASSKLRIPLKTKLTKLESFLPHWCLIKLVESKDVSWLETNIAQMRRVMEALEEALKQVMSEDMVKETASMMLARVPQISKQTPAEIEKRYIHNQCFLDDAFLGFWYSRMKCWGIVQLTLLCVSLEHCPQISISTLQIDSAG